MVNSDFSILTNPELEIPWIPYQHAKQKSTIFPGALWLH